MKRSRVLIPLVIIALFASAVAVTAQDLDPDGSPTFGGWTLEPGFQPDPLIITAISGGPIAADGLGLGANCAGSINDVPDYRISWSGQTAALRVFFTSQNDTTLVVRTPSGKYACNDDYDGLNPLVILTNPEAGDYLIWIGSYEASTFVPGYLFVTEQASSPYNILSPLVAAAGGNIAEPPHTHEPVETPEVSETGLIPGVQHFESLSVLHVEGRVTYPQVPPVGGEHNPVWLNCGIYDQPVRNENAVHSLEHGAVWITYDPSLPAADVEALRALTRGSTHRILSPYIGLPSPVVASAWGYQLQLDNANDPRLPQFIGQFEQGPTTPEPGATCSGGVGNPLQ